MTTAAPIALTIAQVAEEAVSRAPQRAPPVWAGTTAVPHIDAELPSNA
jgi:hypothetical protein